MFAQVGGAPPAMIAPAGCSVMFGALVRQFGHQGGGCVCLIACRSHMSTSASRSARRSARSSLPAESAAPAVTLFGLPTLQAGGDHTVFTTERPFQLLAYLACHRRWVRRDELADILYPERDAVQARSNLRKVLLLADRVPGVNIERQGDLLRWLPDSDLRAFEAAIEGRRLHEAIALGGATLLEGFDGAFLGAGTAWLLAERQRLATLWQSACMQRLAELADQPSEAARLARAMLKRDALDESALQALARAHIALGEGEAARVAIAAYARRLADELGLEPTSAVRALADAAHKASTHPVPAPKRLTHTDDAFIGRRDELSRIVELLRQPSCRLLTVTGPGGVGKTSLAGQLGAWLVPTIVESVVFVPLAELTDVDQVPAQIAVRLGVALSGGAEPWPQIGVAIGERALALVLDNAEQIAIGRPLEHLLQATPRLKVIVTSRARLGVAPETAFALEGLPLPDDDESDIDVLRCCDAVALLESRALTASRSFDLGAQSRDAVRLVHAVQGLPLAIELAAIWTRLLPLAEIANEIVRSVDLLEGDLGSTRGLRASFAQSWRLLSDTERTCLPRLALLPGDFDRDMALQVAGAPLPVLGALVDKSLLRADGSGRFSMHPLLRSCATEHAVSVDDVMTRLAAFVAHWLGEWDGVAATMQLLIVRITAELAHVRAAWSWALKCSDASLIARMARPLSNFFEQQGLWSEGMAALAGAVQALRSTNAPDERALGIVLRGLSALQFHASALDEAEASAQEMMGLAQSLDDVRLMRYAINMHGICLRKRGRFEEARACFEHGLERAQKEGSSPHTALFTANIAATDAYLGRYEEALAGHERALAMYREQLNDFTAAIELIGIGVVNRVLGRPAQAVERLNEALVACVQHGFKATQCAVSLNLGLSFDEMQQSTASRKWLATALHESRQHGAPEVEVLALLASIRLDSQAGETDAARTRVWQALTLAERMKSMPLRTQCVAAFGEILMHEGQLQDGVALIRWAMAQPAIDRLSRDLLNRHLAVLLDRHQRAALEPRELSPETPLATVLAIAAAPSR